MKKRWMVLALTLAAAAPAAAQPEPSATEVALVREFLEVTRTSENLTRTMEAMLQGGMGAEMGPGFADVMREFFAEHLRYEALEPGFIRMYSDLFTEEELRGLIAFYRTPVGQRMAELTPEIAVRTQQITNEVMQEAMPELMELMMESMEDMEDMDLDDDDEDPPVRRKS
ncbi:MAG TPA: DUF2059 domain-containing protein [Longimicrobium sp.]|nr:DUF2059 domain-containing protein [Longimicrobium sp.]